MKTAPLKKWLRAHDVGKAINPAVRRRADRRWCGESLDSALTEDFPLDHGKPLAKFGTLGLFRADKTPPVESIIVEENKDPLAYGAVGNRRNHHPNGTGSSGRLLKLDGNSVRHCLWKTQHTERVKSKKKNLDKGAEGRAVWSCALKKILLPPGNGCMQKKNKVY